MLSQELLNILCCPGCHGSLIYDREVPSLTCSSCGRIFDVKDDIPIMLTEDDGPQPSTHD